MAAPVSPPSSPPSPAPRRAPAWWRRPWMVPLFLLAAAFLAFSVPPYLTLDPSLAKLEPPPGNALYYPLLVAHVLFGAVAMVTGCLQVWPWLRRQHRRVHRVSGRVYVFGGVLPAGITALYIGVHTPFGPSVLVSNVWMAVLWLGCTALGWRAVRQRRMDDHRTWMVRSFALTMSIIMTRLLAAPALLILYPRMDTMFGGSEEMLMYVSTSINTWLGWTLMLVVAEWFLRRPRSTRQRAGTSQLDR
ncbi:uncharacterized membrane protein YozB (DUF420 family) [Lipingzhangella halophila]|uniref:Uncharacterized membrane protein YozB (DUF420 family) n=1 Tax=Lipingzhangella halophila TaxID=1783352 RepID=A0A7W7W408_9ACTN|nr:DUF2306 domain-containing protein [Lipingzhangella halophila]MBB4932265.1 uncharacterized membrane protein YozB (DUF420 family) [Lipingzhangella halophila]